MSEWKQVVTTLKVYKQRQRISYPAIAQALGLKERQVYRIFQGKGDLLNSYALLRQLSQILAIPPHLLGLSLTERPPTEIGREIAKRRKARRISQEALAEKMDRSVEFVSRLENKGEGLDNMRRRKALSLLLGVPPALMGLADASIPMNQIVQTVDLELYQHRLDQLYQAYYNGATTLAEVEQQIAQLEQLEQDSETRTMLYRYHTLALLIAREDYNFHAIHVHSQACVDLAGDDAINLALAHYHRAEACREIELYGEAVTQIGLALNINSLPPSILCRLALEAGTIHYSAPPGIGAGTRYGARMLSQAEKLFPRVEGSYTGGIFRFSSFGEDFLALRRTMAFVNDPSACAQAIEEARGLSKMMPRRAMILDTYEADLAAKKGNIEEAILLTARAERKARELQSQLNLARVAKLYKKLKQQQ